MTQTGYVLDEIRQERGRQQTIGYTPEHDDAEGVPHLVQEAHYRLGHMGEVASPASVREEMLQAAAILVAGIEAIDRANPELAPQQRSDVLDIEPDRRSFDDTPSEGYDGTGRY